MVDEINCDALHEATLCATARVLRSVFFFFQAEDGIRDLTVTGVQTCALPICRTADGGTRGGVPRLHRSRSRGGARGAAAGGARGDGVERRGERSDVGLPAGEIGRASCRERV